MNRRAFLAWAAPPELLIAAASDLAPVERELAGLVAARCRFTFGSSGMLARQITHGAPYDVFLSADEKYAGAGARLYAIGRLALWSRNGAVKDLAALAGVRWVAMANPEHAPYGRAARQALERAGIWPRVRQKIVLAENVRQAFQFAESGNANACLVAYPLVRARGGILLDAKLHDPLRQMARVVKPSVAADAFLDALTSPRGKALLKAAGFEIE